MARHLGVKSDSSDNSTSSSSSSDSSDSSYSSASASGSGSGGVVCTAASSGASGESGDRRLAGGGIWFCFRWEKEHVEACMAIPMILMAIVFETGFHHVKHNLEHAYVFGHQMLSEDEKQAMRNAAVFGKPLKLSFITRMGGEFMVLGFLAVFVWFLNRIGIFDSIADANPDHQQDNINLPRSGGDFLHLAESVHMILFIAMAFYFGFTFCLVECALKRTAMFESMRGAMIEKLKATKAGIVLPPNPKLEYFSMLRAHFLNHGLHGILGWREKRPEEFAQIVQSMGLDIHSASTISLEELRMRFQGCFSFATFLAFAIREKIEEVIEINKYTWLFIIIIQTWLAILHRFEVRLKTMALVFQGFTVVVILFFYAKARSMRRYIDQYHASESVPEDTGCSKYANMIDGWMDYMMSWAQILIFFNSYVLAYVLVDMVQDSGEVGDMFFFENNTERVVLILVTVGSVIFQVAVLPPALTDSSYLTSLPPFFTEMDLHLVLHILKAGGATGAAWGAAYVDEKNAQMIMKSKTGKTQMNLGEDKKCFKAQESEPVPAETAKSMLQARRSDASSGLEKPERGMGDSGQSVLLLGKAAEEFSVQKSGGSKAKHFDSLLPVQTPYDRPSDKE